MLEQDGLIIGVDTLRRALISVGLWKTERKKANTVPVLTHGNASGNLSSSTAAIMIDLREEEADVALSP